MKTPLNQAKILITGGTGSFGRTMAEHLLQRGCPEIRIFSRDEWKQDSMRVDFADERLKFYLGDVRSAPSVEKEKLMSLGSLSTPRLSSIATKFGYVL